jgi:hypothetical protein
MSAPYEGDSTDGTPGVKGTNINGTGVWGESQQGYGVYGFSHAGFAGVVGQNEAPTSVVWLPNILQALGCGVQGLGGMGVGVIGLVGGKNPGVVGYCDGGGPGVCGVTGNSQGAQYPVGVWGESTAWDGVYGVCHSAEHVGVSGNNTAGGCGVYGWSGFTGTANLQNVGVFGGSGSFDAIVGETQSAANAGVTGRNLTSGANGGCGVYGTGGKYAGKFDGAVQVNGSLYVRDDVWLTGADFAEDFAVENNDSIEPGTVMVLDQAGVLRPCRTSYDRKVAGVISGAGDYRPGLILDRSEPRVGRLPLALVGKVYCKADSEFGPIEVGDMLTTAPTPGHAMKADNPALAFGAVIGKALRPLATGRALIPILIALQ